MRCDIITSPAGLAALWPEWEGLWARVPGAPPFLAPAWLRPWWDCFGTEMPLVGVLRDAGRVVGVLPLYRLGDRLLPLGVGISDFFDVLLEAAAPSGAATQLLTATLETSPVPRCELAELPPGSALRAVGPPPGWTRQEWAGPPCPALELQPAPAIPAGMRRDIRQARNRAGRAGGFTIRNADATTLDADLATLIALHTARWEVRGAPGVLADPAVQRFHRAAGPGLLASGMLRLATLTMREAPAAAILSLLGADTIYFYLSGFATEHGFESPGTILLAAMLETAAAEGRATAHFLRGGEAYKYAWGAVDRPNLGITLCRR